MMKKPVALPLILTVWMLPLSWAVAAQRSANLRGKHATPSTAVSTGRLASIAPVIQKALADRKMPGAVVVIGHHGRVVYQRAFGYRALEPRRLPMKLNTMFDMASLTKVIATTPAIMQLVEQGRIRLEDPVAAYWPEFAANGKDQITVRELMTHFSGLPPDLELKPEWSGYLTAMGMIAATAPIVPPGTRFIYSDINYEVLGELVRRVSGEALDVYCARHIFSPLGMRDTMFLPPARLRPRIAPTERLYGTTGPILWGTVHDPTARAMGGVAGHAGIFSTGHDLAVLAQALLAGGLGGAKRARILSEVSVDKMTSPQTPPGKTAVRGLGWDIDSPFSSNRGELFPVGSFGHTGFTGTDLWIDPFSNTYVILLTNAVHPTGEGNVVPLRGQIADIAAAAFARAPSSEQLAQRLLLTSHTELENSYRLAPAHHDQTQTGIDVLESQGFTPLNGLRVGLITNASGRDSEGRRTIDLLAHTPQVRLVAIFSPEHGLFTNVDERVKSTTEPTTGVPVYSLYGDTLRPTDAMLEGLDALLYDIQDAGARYYTYRTTLGYTMEAAAKKGIAYYVLDRPDPIGGLLVEGPLLDSDLLSFVGYFPLPVRDGMTVGELARLFNQEKHLGLKLNVIEMRNWHRSDWFDQTSLDWVNPSPNLRNLTEATLYPGVGMIEGANLSVGRGTDTPFEVLGAPWIDGRKLAGYLSGRHIQGVRFSAYDFTPASSRFKGELCHGVQINLVDRDALDAPEFGVEIAAALYKLFPQDFQIDKTLPLVGSHQVIEGIKHGRDPRRLAYEWEQGSLAEFRRLRARYLLY